MTGVLANTVVARTGILSDVQGAYKGLFILVSLEPWILDGTLLPKNGMDLGPK